MGALVGAGDISTCENNNDEATARLLDRLDGTIFTVGDNVYESGTARQFQDCYDPTWGRHLARTRPSPGNHEYRTAGASGYYGYFGSNAGAAGLGYYSYDVGGWHVLSLNSNVPASVGTPQYRVGPRRSRCEQDGVCRGLLAPARLQFRGARQRFDDAIGLAPPVRARRRGDP